MTKRRAVGIVLAFFAVFFGAILLRVDYFPLTWVPMYGHRHAGPVLEVTVGSLDRRDRGLTAIRADGRSEQLNGDALNVPPANFRRLYAERMFGEGPPQDRRERMELIAFNRWWYDSLVGPQSVSTGMYQRRLIDSVNRTLGRAPGSPEEIVQLKATVGRLSLTREQRNRGDISVRHQNDVTAIATRTGTRFVEHSQAANDGR